MSKYTTGEIAKLCGVTVRTVQYYDTRGILIPSELSEGGRRLYSEDDLQRLRVICFLRGLGLPINSIADLIQQENSREVISLLLQQQSELLRSEIQERQDRLQRLTSLEKALRSAGQFSLESIGDMAFQMENKKKLRKTRIVMLCIGIPIEIIEVVGLILWITKGLWQAFVLSLIVALPLAVWLSAYYFKRVTYICPQCHSVFRPGFREAFFAAHTPNTRKLSCTRCGHKGYCIETAAPEPKQK